MNDMAMTLYTCSLLNSPAGSLNLCTRLEDASISMSGFCAPQDVTEHLEDIREYDVPYHVRFAIDTDVRCGHWFNVKCRVRMMERCDRSFETERVCALLLPTYIIPLRLRVKCYDYRFKV